MQGDHLLSVAGVSEQAGSVCAHSLDSQNCTQACKHTRADRSTHSHEAGGVRRQRDTCAHTCTNRQTQWEFAQQTVSKLLYKLNVPLFFNSVRLSNVLQISSCKVTENAHSFYAAHKYLRLSPHSSWRGIICWWCEGRIN